jgi:hypothetical protein
MLHKGIADNARVFFEQLTLRTIQRTMLDNAIH